MIKETEKKRKRRERKLPMQGEKIYVIWLEEEKSLIKNAPVISFITRSTIDS